MCNVRSWSDQMAAGGPAQEMVGASQKNLSDPNDNQDFDFPAWLIKHQDFSDALVPQWVEGVKAKYGKLNTKFVCIGYCYSAPYVCDQLSEKG